MAVTDRRRASRRVPAADEPLQRVRLRTGREMDVVDVSNSGVLVEGASRLLPNTHLDVHIVTRGGRVLVRCRVVRACVCHLEADIVRYQVALAFERNIDTSTGYAMPPPLPGEYAAPGSGYPPEPPDTATADVELRSA